MTLSWIIPNVIQICIKSGLKTTSKLMREMLSQFKNRELLRNSEISYRSYWHRSLSSDRHHILFYIICEKWPEQLVSRNEYIFFGIFHHVSRCITSNAHKVSMQILKLLIFYSFIPLMILSSLLSDVFLVSLSFSLFLSINLVVVCA